MQSSAMALDNRALWSESLKYRGTGGDSRHNHGAGFEPAFLDTATGHVYRSCHRDGRPAGCHLLDGLPSELITARAPSGHVTAVKHSVIAGFLRAGRFYTREQASIAAAPG
jgi:hypothetical protein